MKIARPHERAKVINYRLIEEQSQTFNEGLFLPIMHVKKVRIFPLKDFVLDNISLQTKGTKFTSLMDLVTLASTFTDFKFAWPIEAFKGCKRLYAYEIRIQPIHVQVRISLNQTISKKTPRTTIYKGVMFRCR